MITVIFVQGKETKRTWRYELDNSDLGIAGSLYLSKDKVKELGNPKKLEVTISVK